MLEFQDRIWLSDYWSGFFAGSHIIKVTICTNGLATDEHKSVEISMWFDDNEIRDRLFLWESKDHNDLLAYVKEIILQHLQ